MTAMNKNEKRLMLLNMQEHPERYTDEQMESLLADEDVKQFFTDMAMARMAMKKGEKTQVDVDKEWRRFSEKRIHRNRMKVAAAIIGGIFFSVIAVAVVSQSGLIGHSYDTEVAQTTLNATTVKSVKPEISEGNEQENVDSLDTKPVTFDNVKLKNILDKMSIFYHVKVEYRNTEAGDVRLYYNWDKKKTLEENVKLMNAFERFHLNYAGGVIEVK